MKVDLCCGDKKRPGSMGVDWAPGPEIDVVHDLNVTPWPLETGSCEDILCEHGIEHVVRVDHFMSEIHRILKPGGQVKIVTPHFSSMNSWGDPTHVRHLSAYWFEVFTPGGYLASQTGAFELVETKVLFGKSLWALIGQFLVKIRGLKKWEKNLSFVFRGMDIHTTLKALKP